MERDWYVDVVIFTFLDHITSFFENQRVLGPWVTIDTPLRIRKLQESEYQTTVSVVFWFGHTLWRDTLQLEGLVDGVRSVRYSCEIMHPRHMEVALQKKSKKK